MYTPRTRLVALLAVAVLAASCAGKPPVKTPEPSPQPEPQVVQPTPPPAAPAIKQAELDALLSQVQTLKKHAFDLQIYTVLPDGYKAADAAYADAKASFDTSTSSQAAQDMETTKTKLTTAGGLFKDLIAKGVVELATDKRKDADDQKALAVKASAETAVPERFVPAGKAYDTGVALVNGGKHEEAIAAFERARLFFELSWKRANAIGLKARIADKGFASFDSGNASMADSKLAEEDRLFIEAGGVDAAANVATDPARYADNVDALDYAILRYNLVVQAARTEIATRQRSQTDDVKQRSEGIKANVAAKEEYAAALADYQAAGKAFGAGEFEEATDLYATAAKGFENAYTVAADKRAKAQAALDAAAAAQSESLKRAQSGDTAVEADAKAQSGEAPADAQPKADATSSATSGSGN